MINILSIPSVPVNSKYPDQADDQGKPLLLRDHSRPGEISFIVNPSQLYPLHKKVDSRPSYSNLMATIEANQAWRRKRSKDIAKILLSERISGRSIADSSDSVPESSPYLEYNAQSRGDLEETEERNKINNLRYAENVVNQCGKSSVWFKGVQSENFYVKKIDCRKPWCPVCGGKGGKVHNSRLHAILSRVNPEKYNIRQFVFTVPDSKWLFFQTRENLSKLVAASKQTIEKFFGEPVFDKYGHVKKYKLEKGAIEYLHLFGETAGEFKPHVNVHIFEDKKARLKIEPCVLEAIKKYWLKRLVAITGDRKIESVDVHYSFRNNVKKNVHSIKYMCRPWSSADYAAVQDEALKKLLVLDLSGFVYVRFWGAMANCKYKDEMSLPEVKEQVESVVGEKLQFLFFAPTDIELWKDKLIEISDGLYVVRNKNIEERNFKECCDFFKSIVK